MSTVDSKNKELMRQAVDNIDLKYCNRAEGESEHDYVPVYIWYEKDPLYRGPGPRNSDLCLKMRCRNCGRIISMDTETKLALLQKYEKSSSVNNRSFDYAKLCSTIDCYVLPEGVGPFSVRYIYDDGTAEVRELGHNNRSRTIRISRMERLPESDTMMTDSEKLLLS